MAAILEPQRFPRPTAPARPDLRLIPGGRSPRPAATRPVPAAVIASLLLVVLLVAGTIAVGRGALAGRPSNRVHSKCVMGEQRATLNVLRIPQSRCRYVKVDDRSQCNKWR